MDMMAKALFTTKSNNDSTGDEHPAVRIISSTSPDLRSGPSDVKEILCASCSGFGGYRTLIHMNDHGAFLIWTQEVFEPASWSLDQACTHVERQLRQQDAGATIVLCFNDSVEEKTARLKTFMISVLSLKAETAKSVTIPYQDRQALEEELFESMGRRSTVHRGYIKRNLAFIIAALILVIMGITLAALPIVRRSTTKVNNVWLSWDLPKDSKGPKNQLQFTWPHPNFTTWSAENGRSVDDFYLRLDDQTMIPTEYVDDYELQYQDWYAKHYPWFAEIGDSKAYLNESYWRDTRSYPLAIDHEFHVAHCVLTMKRYWKARESNHHVCPRDINHNHISHCFGVLESYAFNVSHHSLSKGFRSLLNIY